MKKERLREAEELQSQLVEWRRALHQMPEVGLSLPQTRNFIKERLEEMKIPYKSYDEISCIEAWIGTGDPCFLLRSDMDGLPIQEETNLPFQSVNGCMHGCGHDLHAAMLLGAAKLLKAHEEQLKGTVKLLFQAGEENFQGAKAAVKAGVLEDPEVKAAFAMHVIAMIPVGVFLTGKEPMASVDGFRITFTGKGGHGSMPEICIDPVNAAVQMYLALQSLIAREVGGTEEAVLTVGRLCAGEAANIIPEEAVLEGTLRTFHPKVRERLVKRIQETAEYTAKVYRCQHKYEVLSACPGVVTDDAVTAQVRRSICSLFGEDGMQKASNELLHSESTSPVFVIKESAHGMGSEDFAEITGRVPGAYFMMGAGAEDPKKRLGQHNPGVEFNEAVLSTGAAIYAQVAEDWLEDQALAVSKKDRS